MVGINLGSAVALEMPKKLVVCHKVGPIDIASIERQTWVAS